MVWLDQWVLVCLIPLAIWILTSGLDDLFVSLVYLIGGTRFDWPSEPELEQAPERRIAILVPLWREHRVIGQMLDRNLAAIRYQNYDVFVGTYPNDEPTVRAVTAAAETHARVHLVVCPHNGPTSKGDCLNWIFRGMESYEARHGVRYEVIVMHDAEDLIHPESLRLINWYSPAYDMVQVPVLPLPLGLEAITHGLYCDEFAEYQSKDIPVRRRLGGFLPSNGVGTGFGRVALRRLAATREGRVFDPECLTEDYQTGYQLHAMGCTQIFVPLRFGETGPAATREYFPRRLRAAIRQRSRWVTGIALQGWQKNGWRAPWQQIYWFWRDRKGLVGNLITPLANAIFLYGIARYSISGGTVAAWNDLVPAWLTRLCEATLWITLLQATIRTFCAARIYGWVFAGGVPLRMLWGNLVNSSATVVAVWQFWRASRKQRAPAWQKTEHVYPGQAAAIEGKPLLGEVLVRMRCVSTSDLEAALESCPKGTRIGEHLVAAQRLSEENLYQALSSQAGIPLGVPDRHEVNRLATRVLPAEAARRWKVLPYRVAVGQLHVLTADLPSEELAHDLAAFSALEIRYRLVRPKEFEEIAREYLPGASRAA
ncbi:MAG TPA: glycosyl transferase family protein [Bryobacteraceae bacterium]|nr:glycosyl transferase family protein [Bryobacteraceae bacterium]